MPFNYAAATCTMPDCDADLALIVTLARGLVIGDFTEPYDPAMFPPADAHSTDWKIGCAEGHVIAVPRPTVGCPCDDPGGDGCEHDEDDFDTSEDYRAFRASDWARVRDPLAPPIQPGPARNATPNAPTYRTTAAGLK